MNLCWKYPSDLFLYPPAITFTISCLGWKKKITNWILLLSTNSGLMLNLLLLQYLPAQVWFPSKYPVSPALLPLYQWDVLHMLWTLISPKNKRWDACMPLSAFCFDITRKKFAKLLSLHLAWHNVGTLSAWRLLSATLHTVLCKCIPPNWT